MTTRYQPVSYPIFGGVETKVSPYVLPAPKLQMVQNAYSDQTGSLKRRFGRSALTNSTVPGGSLSNWVGLAKHQDRLLGFTSDNKIHDYASPTARWSTRGRMNSFRITANNVDAVDQEVVTPVHADMAIAGNYKCFVYDYHQVSGANFITRTIYTMIDSTGTRYSNGVSGAENLLSETTNAVKQYSHAKVVAFGNRFYIIFRDVNTAATIKCHRIDTTSASTIQTDLAASYTTLATDWADKLDVSTHATFGPFIAYRNTTALTLAFGHVNTSGALIDTGTSTVGANPTALTTATTTGAGGHAIVYVTGAGASDVFAKLLSWDGAAWTVISSAAMDTAVIAPAAHPVCKWDSTSLLRVWYSDIIGTRPGIRQGTFSTSSVISSRIGTPLPRSFMAAKPFVGTDGATYYWVFSEPLTSSITQPTLYLIKNTDDDGNFAPQFEGQSHTGAFYGVSAGSVGTSHVVSSGSSFSFAGYAYSRITTSAFAGQAGYDKDKSTTMLREFVVRMTHSTSHTHIEDGECSLIPGGVVQQYDGLGCTEVGFSQFVDTQNRITIGAAQITNGAGALTNAANTVYSYRIVPEWTNAQGQREQGTDGGAKTTLAADWAAGDDTVTFTIDCIPWTRKKTPRQDLSFAVYRTLANPSDSSPFFRVGTVANDPTTSEVTFTDLMSDAVAATQEALYLDAQLDNTAPPAGHILAAGNGRVFVAGVAAAPNSIWYSKTREPGEALAFNDALRIFTPEAGGAIISMAVMNEALIVFCENGVYRVVGDGLNNAGGGSGFANPQLILTDGTSRNHRSTLVTPIGTFYQSLRGMMLLDPSLNARYIGAPLEKLSDPGDAVGISLVPNLQQVRVSFTGTTHVYDYFHHQWYVFTHSSQGPTVVYNDLHTAVHSSSTITQDSTSTWTDSGTAYTMVVTLGWFKLPATMQGNLRIRRVGLTGESLDAHNLKIELSHDYESTVNQTITETVAAASLLKKQYRSGRQICMALEVSIRDDNAGGTVQATAGMLLNEVVFEIGVRGGLATRRV